MNIDTSGIDSGTIGQIFTQGEKVMLRRLGGVGGNREYRAKIAGIAVDDVIKIMICEIVDPLPADYPFSHIAITEACIDKENW